MLHTYRRRKKSGTLMSIPWALLEPFEAQAKANHGQSLETLASRGGLSPTEALAIIQGRRLFEVDHTDDAVILAEVQLREMST